MSMPKAQQADRQGFFSHVAATYPGEWVVIFDVNIGSCHSAVTGWKNNHPGWDVELTGRNTYKAGSSGKTSIGDAYLRFTRVE